MNKSEFVKKVKELGFIVKEKEYTMANEVWLIVCEGEHTEIMGVENTRFVIDTDYANFIDLDYYLKEKLFDLAVEYARTPIKERGEEKKYHVRLPWLDEDFQCLNLNKSTGRYLIATKSEFSYCQTKFTMEEIEELKEKYNLDSFEIVEAPEDEI